LMRSFSGHFVRIGCVHIIGCAFNQFQVQMHKLRPSLRVQLDHDSNAQLTGGSK
jgi:hypothetical protein